MAGNPYYPPGMPGPRSELHELVCRNDRCPHVAVRCDECGGDGCNECDDQGWIETGEEPWRGEAVVVSELGGSWLTGPLEDGCPHCGEELEDDGVASDD